MPEKNYEPDQWLRVRDRDTGHETSILGVQLPHGDYEVLDGDALDLAGRPVPPKFGDGPTPPTARKAADASKEKSS